MKDISFSKRIVLLFRQEIHLENSSSSGWSGGVSFTSASSVGYTTAVPTYDTVVASIFGRYVKGDLSSISVEFDKPINVSSIGSYGSSNSVQNSDQIKSMTFHRKGGISFIRKEYVYASTPVEMKPEQQLAPPPEPQQLIGAGGGALIGVAGNGGQGGAGGAEYALNGNVLIVNGSGNLTWNYNHCYLTNKVRRAVGVNTARSISRAMDLIAHILDRAFKSRNLPPELYELQTNHPDMSLRDLFMAFACPYTQMILPKNASAPTVKVRPELYLSPKVRKAIRSGNFKELMLHWVGNSTKPVVRAAGNSAIFTKRLVVDKTLIVNSDVKIPEGEWKYPILFNAGFFKLLVGLKVPLEKAAHITSVYSGHDQYNLLNTDSLINFTSNPNVLGGVVTTGEYAQYEYDHVKKLFDLVGVTQAINYLFSSPEVAIEDSAKFTLDTVRMIFEFSDSSKFKSTKSASMFPNGLRPKKSWKTIKEIHDDVSRNYTKIKLLEQKRAIKWPEELKSLHGKRVDDLRILLPRSTTNVVKWGKDQSHCVASYADRCADGSEIIFGVYKAKKLSYIGRISRQSWSGKHPSYTFGPPNQVNDAIIKAEQDKVILKLGEIRAERNNKLPPDDLKKIYNILMEFKVEDLYEGRF